MKTRPNSLRTLEIILVLTSVALCCVLHRTIGYKVIVLNLFYLPVSLAAFYLGRYRAGILAFFCFIAVSMVATVNMSDFSSVMSPVVVGLSIMVWGAVLGLTALLIGTLSDDLNARMVELHEAHVGVVEVLARYLQRSHPGLKNRSQRIVELCQAVARQMRLSPNEIDDIRVAALLCDMGNVEITARVIKKAIGDLGDQTNGDHHTFHGTELAQSLKPILLGAFPLVLDNPQGAHDANAARVKTSGDVPFGARIIRTVREYDALVHGEWAIPGIAPEAALAALRADLHADHHPLVLDALARVIRHARTTDRAQPSAELNETEPACVI